MLFFLRNVSIIKGTEQQVNYYGNKWKKEMNIEMADEFKTKPEEEQNKREQAKRDLADLQKLMAQVQGDSSAKSDRDTQPKPAKQEAVSVDELINRAASEAEQDAEPQDAEQAEQAPETPSQIDGTQSKPEESESTEPEASETPEEKQQAEQEQREQVLNQQKRRRQAAQAAAGTPIELDLRKKTAEKIRCLSKKSEQFCYVYQIFCCIFLNVFDSLF